MPTPVQPSDNLLANLGVSIPTLEIMLSSQAKNGFDLVWSILKITIISFLMGIINQISSSSIISYIKVLPKYFEKPLNKLVLKSKHSTNVNGNPRNSCADLDSETLMSAILNYLGKSKENLGESELLMVKGMDGCMSEKYLSHISFGFKPMIRFQLGDYFYTYSEVQETHSSKDDIVLFKTMKTMVIESHFSSDTIKEHVEKIHEDYIKQQYPYIKKEYPSHLYPSRDLTQKLVRDSENDKGMRELEKHKAARLVYQKHILNNRTNFNQLFFPGKEKLMRRLREFLDPTNPMSKFTLLLYGPPGGGKTSIIKAIQQMCGYDVISVRLNDFRSYEDFFELFHGSVLKVSESGSISNYELPSSKRLIVMDDVDADNTIVHDRKKKDKEKQLMMKIIGKRLGIDSDSSNSSDNSDSSMDSSKKKNKKKSQKRTTTPSTDSSDEYETDDMSEDSHGSSSDSDAEDETSNKLDKGKSQTLKNSKDSKDSKETTKGKSKKEIQPILSVEEKKAKKRRHKNRAKFPMGFGRGPLFNMRDELQLSDILNILDGINELNKTIIIMTTNHIEKLDPALIRPGRVNWRQEMTYVRYEDMLDIMKHFFGLEAVNKAIKDKNLDEYLHALYDKKIMVSKFTEFCVHEDEITDAIQNFEIFLSQKN